METKKGIWTQALIDFNTMDIAAALRQMCQHTLAITDQEKAGKPYRVVGLEVKTIDGVKALHAGEDYPRPAQMLEMTIWVEDA